MHKTLISLLILVCFAGSSKVSANSCEDIRGKWITNMKSVVHFEKLDKHTGLISGAYYPASTPDQGFPLTGFVNTAGKKDNGQHYAIPVSFAVSFQKHGGITNWSGVCYITDGKPIIETEDLIVAPMADYIWSHVIDNHDTLVPVETEK